MAMFGNRRQSSLGDLLASAIEAHAQTARQAAQRPAPRAVARTYHPPISERIGNALAPLIGREGGHSLGSLLRDWTPIGNIEGVAADPSLRSPNALLSALPIPGPARRAVSRFRDILPLPSPSRLNSPRNPTADEMRRVAQVQRVPLSQARQGNNLQWERFNTGDPPLVPGYTDRPVAVQLENGEYILLDGNHRAALANHRGDREMEMHVIPARAYDPENAGRAPAPYRAQDLDALLSELQGLSPAPRRR